ncbi:hypothetical protein CN630_32815, partial [Bacillus wiedmannii]|uniref:hypothetical protein n=1 Tax=Bacillus wiedmannii TaxID=1890302 RepID=UPI000BFAB4B0
MELYTYLLNRYGYDEPIFTEDLKDELKIKPSTLRQQLKRLTDTKRIERCKFKSGIYFIADPDSILSTKAISVNKIITKKYLVKEQHR